MIVLESDEPPTRTHFDLAIVAVGYEKRCRWVVEQAEISAGAKCGLEFGFLRAGSYADNRSYFEDQEWSFANGVDAQTPAHISTLISAIPVGAEPTQIFVDVSSMSREMIANVLMGL